MSEEAMIAPAEFHASVLLAEVVSVLAPRSGGRYADVTTGLGGHAEAILEASSPGGTLIAIDRDPKALELARVRLARFGARVTFVRARFSELDDYVDPSSIDGLVADLGVSSMQLDERARGFSFSSPGPIDMRMGSEGETALELIERCSTEDLASILSELGEVRGAKRVARAIHEALSAGQLTTTSALAEVIARVSEKGGRTHPATRAFMALRIATNAELLELDSLLVQLPITLAPSGRAAVISFHSLEDRRVKRATLAVEPAGPFPRGLPVPRTESPLSQIGKSIAPSEAELARNPRSRSARLRVLARR